MCGVLTGACVCCVLIAEPKLDCPILAIVGTDDIL